MELKQKIDRLRDKVQPLTIPAIGLFIIMIGTLLWKAQQDNVDSLQSKIEHLKKEIAQPSSTNEILKLEERLKLEKDILAIEKDKTTIQNGVYSHLAPIHLD
jgi:septal ring factor EnvC (AmiA/AmiB activator)